MNSRSGSGINSERANTVQKKFTFCGGFNHSAEKCFKMIIQEKEKARAAGDSDNRWTERTPQKKIICGSEDHLISKCPKPPKENEKQRNQVRFNDKCNRACKNGENNSNQKIYASMARMSVNENFPCVNFGNSLKLTNWILGSGATCHMTPEVSDFIPG